MKLLLIILFIIVGWSIFTPMAIQSSLQKIAPDTALLAPPDYDASATHTVTATPNRANLHYPKRITTLLDKEFPIPVVLGNPGPDEEAFLANPLEKGVQPVTTATNMELCLRGSNNAFEIISRQCQSQTWQGEDTPLTFLWMVKALKSGERQLQIEIRRNDGSLSLINIPEYVQVHVMVTWWGWVEEKLKIIRDLGLWSIIIPLTTYFLGLFQGKRKK